MIYSDEASLQNSPNTPNGWLFRLPSQKWDIDKVNTQEHVKATITIMVWGAIWKGGRSHLVVMIWDETSRRNGYTSWSYQRALEEGLLPYYDDERFFQQDNAPIHKSRSSMEWLRTHGIRTVQWPAHSPDMNPIEHVWKKMKEILYKDFPHLCFLTGSEVNIQEFVAALKVAWERVPQALIDRLIDSMRERVAELRRVRGWYTHY